MNQTNDIKIENIFPMYKKNSEYSYIIEFLEKFEQVIIKNEVNHNIEKFKLYEFYIYGLFLLYSYKYYDKTLKDINLDLEILSKIITQETSKKYSEPLEDYLEILDDIAGLHKVFYIFIYYLHDTTYNVFNFTHILSKFNRSRHSNMNYFFMINFMFFIDNLFVDKYNDYFHNSYYNFIKNNDQLNDIGKNFIKKYFKNNDNLLINFEKIYDKFYDNSIIFNDKTINSNKINMFFTQNICSLIAFYAEPYIFDKEEIKYIIDTITIKYNKIINKNYHIKFFYNFYIKYNLYYQLTCAPVLIAGQFLYDNYNQNKLNIEDLSINYNIYDKIQNVLKLIISVICFHPNYLYEIIPFVEIYDPKLLFNINYIKLQNIKQDISDKFSVESMPISVFNKCFNNLPSNNIIAFQLFKKFKKFINKNIDIPKLSEKFFPQNKYFYEQASNFFINKNNGSVSFKFDFHLMQDIYNNKYFINEKLFKDIGKMYKFNINTEYQIEKIFYMHIINECIHQFNKNTNMYFYSKLVKVNKFNTKEIFNQLFHIYSVQKNNMSDDNTIYIINEEQKQYLPLKLFCSLKNVNCDYEAYKLIILNNKKLKNTNIGLKYLDILEYLTNLLSYNVQIFKSLQKLIKISIQKNFNLKNDYISDIFISQQQKNIIYITTSLFRFLNIGPTGKEALVDLSNKYNLKKYFKDDLLLYVTFFLINHFSIKMNLLNDEIRYSKNLSELKIKDDDKKLIDHVYNCYSEVLPDRKIYENIFLESVLEWYNNNLKYRDGIIGNNIGILCIILTDLIYQIQKKQYIKYEDTQNEII